MMKTCDETMNGTSGFARRRRSGSERGVALVLVLVLSAIGLIVMTTVLYVITTGTNISGSVKRYHTAREAALGSVDIIRQLIADQTVAVYPGVTIAYPNLAAFTSKFGGANMSVPRNIDPDDSSTYDFTIDLGNPPYRVYAKMIQLQKGATNKGYKTVRVKTGVVPPEGLQGGMFIPTYYTFTLLAQKTTNPNERFKLDVVHIF